MYEKEALKARRKKSFELACYIGALLISGMTVLVIALIFNNFIGTSIATLYLILAAIGAFICSISMYKIIQLLAPPRE